MTKLKNSNCNKKGAPVYKYTDQLFDGTFRVFTEENGCGILRADGSIMIPPKYSYVREFSEGYAVAITKDNIPVILDKNGKEITFKCWHGGANYSAIGRCADGLIRVSEIDHADDQKAFDRLSEYMDEDCIDEFCWTLGNWGYLNTRGEEVIQPQYEVASDFFNGVAVVGNRKKIDGSGGCGIIDTSGREIVPLKFKEIYFFWDWDLDGSNSNQFFRARGGDYKEGFWGVIDREGNYLEEPYFLDIDPHITKDGCFTFEAGSAWHKDILTPRGIYSTSERRTLFSAQFEDVEFLGEGLIEVRGYDDNGEKIVKKVIDYEGNEVTKGK